MPPEQPDSQALTPAGGKICDHSRSLIAELETVRRRFYVWSGEFKEGAPPPVLDKELVHKHREQNVFVSRVELVGPEHPDQFICQFALDPGHPFFFEHPLDHVPGLMIIEAARQTGNAVCHLLYDVPFGTSFVLSEAHFDFVAFAELSQPLFATGTVAENQRSQIAGVVVIDKDAFGRDLRLRKRRIWTDRGALVGVTVTPVTVDTHRADV